MTEFLMNKPFLGNTVLQLHLTILLVVLSLIAGRVLYKISGTVLKRMARKTKTQFDDILIDMTEEPIIVIGVIVAIRFSLKLLTIVPAVESWIDAAFYFIVLFNIAWLVTRTVDALLEYYLVPIVLKTETDLDDIILPLARTAFSFIVWSLAIIIALDNAGFDVGVVIIGLGLLILAVILLVKYVLNNMIGGLTKWIKLELKLSNKMESGQLEKAHSIINEIVTGNESIKDSKVYLSDIDKAFGISVQYRIEKGMDVFETQNQVNFEVIRRFQENHIEFVTAGV